MEVATQMERQRASSLELKVVFLLQFVDECLRVLQCKCKIVHMNSNMLTASPCVAGFEGGSRLHQHEGDFGSPSTDEGGSREVFGRVHRRRWDPNAHGCGRGQGVLGGRDRLPQDGEEAPHRPSPDGTPLPLAEQSRRRNPEVEATLGKHAIEDRLQPEVVGFRNAS